MNEKNIRINVMQTGKILIFAATAQERHISAPREGKEIACLVLPSKYMWDWHVTCWLIVDTRKVYGVVVVVRDGKLILQKKKRLKKLNFWHPCSALLSI